MKNYKIVAPIAFAALLSACGGGSENTTTTIPSKTTFSSQVLLGPVINADVNIYRVADNTLIHTTTTSDDTNISKAGLFEIPNDILDANSYYLVKVSGGSDIDANDDGIRDDTPTAMNGTVHALIRGSEISSNDTKINPLSELAYQKMKPMLLSEYKSDNTRLQKRLKEVATLLIKEDINGDGVRDEKDLNLFSAKDDRDKIHMSQNSLDALIGHIHAAEDANISALAQATDGMLTPTQRTFSGYGSTMITKGETLFIDSSDGLEAYDITNLQDIALKSSVEEELYTNGMNMALYGDFLITGEDRTLKIFDISDENNITLHSTLGLDGKFFRNAQIKDNTLFVLSSNATNETKNGITVFDINATAGLTQRAFFQMPDNVYQLIIDKNHAFAIYFNGVFNGVDNKGGFDVLDISDVENIHTINSSIREENDHSSTFGAVLHNGYLFVPFYNYGVRIYDVRDVTNITKVSEIPLGFMFQSIIIKDNYAFISSYYDETTYVVDISNIASPEIVSSVDTGKVTSTLSVDDYILYNIDNNPYATIGGFLNTGTWESLSDAQAEYAFETINSQEHSISSYFEELPFNARSMVVDTANSNLYVGGLGIMSLSLSNPLSPNKLDYLYSYGTKSSLTLANNTLYVAGYQNYLEKIDVSNPNNLSFLLQNSYELSSGLGESHAIAPTTAGTFVLSDSTLELFDSNETNASNPLDVYDINLSGGIDPEQTAMVEIGEYLYISAAFDVSESNQSQLLRVFSKPTASQGLTLQHTTPMSTDGFDGVSQFTQEGDRLYLLYSGYNTSELYVFDTTNQATPSLLYKESFNKNAKGLTVKNGVVYIGFSDGFSIYDVTSSYGANYIGEFKSKYKLNALEVNDKYLYALSTNGIEIFPIIDLLQE